MRRSHRLYMHTRSFIAACLPALGIALSPIIAHAQSQPTLDWSLVDGIGGVSVNGDVAVVGTISPEDSGFMAHGTVSFHSVFQPWPGFIYQPPLVSPTLQISLATNHVVIRWPAFFSAYQLECAPTLASAGTNWTAVAQPPVTEGAELHLTLPANTPSRFYRLRLD